MSHHRWTNVEKPVLVPAMLLALGANACASEIEAEPAPPCDQECQDANALRAIRESMKLIYNLTLQGNPVGPQDEIIPCPQGGFARVFGEASSNSMQGATMVRLAYVFQDCSYLRRDEDPEENHDLTMTAVIGQEGTIAVQPSATTALLIASEAVTLSGTIYDPPITYTVEACELLLSQTGSDLSGTICGREAGVDL
jgi:hypothetical protein